MSLHAFKDKVTLVLPDRFLEFWEQIRPPILDIKTDIGMKISFLIDKEIIALFPHLYSASYQKYFLVHSIVTDKSEDEQALHSIIFYIDSVAELATKISQLAKAQIDVLSAKADGIEAEFENVR